MSNPWDSQLLLNTIMIIYKFYGDLQNDESQAVEKNEFARSSS